MARLAIIRQQREEAAKKREAERKCTYPYVVLSIHMIMSGVAALPCSKRRGDCFKGEGKIKELISFLSVINATIIVCSVSRILCSRVCAVDDY